MDQVKRCIDSCNTCIVECKKCIANCTEYKSNRWSLECIELCNVAVGLLAINSPLASAILPITIESCMACAIACKDHSPQCGCKMICHICATDCGNVKSAYTPTGMFPPNHPYMQESRDFMRSKKGSNKRRSGKKHKKSSK